MASASKGLEALFLQLEFSRMIFEKLYTRCLTGEHIHKPARSEAYYFIRLESRPIWCIDRGAAFYKEEPSSSSPGKSLSSQLDAVISYLTNI